MMGIRTVRLDDETEKALEQIVAVTGASVSAAIKKGLLVLRSEIAGKLGASPTTSTRNSISGRGGTP